MFERLHRTIDGRRHCAGEPATASRSGLRYAPASVALAAVTILSACADESEVATEAEGIPTATLTAIDEVPADIGAVSLAVSGGAVGTDELVLQQGNPTILHVVNDDDQPYRLRIGDALVNDVEIAAGDSTEIAFTTPKASTYDGKLLSMNGTVLDEFRVIVQEPGGVID